MSYLVGLKGADSGKTPMPWAVNLLLNLQTHACFTETIYKIGKVCEIYSARYIPQNALYGAFAQALNIINPQNSSVILSKVHVTSAMPTCVRHPWYSFWLEPMASLCGFRECGQIIETRLVKHFFTAPLNPHIWAPYEETKKPIERQYPRRVFALAPGQRFKLHMLVEDDYALNYVLKCLRFLFRELIEEDTCGVRVGSERGLGVSVGWGKKFGWGLFSANYRRVECETRIVDKGVYTLITLSPAPEKDGISLLSGAYRNVKYLADRDLYMFYGGRNLRFESRVAICEGSVVKVDASRMPLVSYLVNVDENLIIELLHERDPKPPMRRIKTFGHSILEYKAFEPTFMRAF